MGIIDVKQIFVYSYSIPKKLIEPLRQLEMIIDNSINEYNLNIGNDDFILLFFGEECRPKINKTTKEIKSILKEEYNNRS